MDEQQRKIIEELKQTWYTTNEAIEELAENGKKVSKASFLRAISEVDFDKEIGFVGKPKTKNEKTGGKGRPLTLYNHAAVEAVRTFALSDTHKKIQEEPIDLFVNDEWKKEITADLKGYLTSNYKDEKINGAGIIDITEYVNELVDKVVIKNYYSLIGQNKFLVHRNKELERTKERLIAESSAIEARAGELQQMAGFIKQHSKSTDDLLINRTDAYFEQLMGLNKKLDKILNNLEKIKKEKN
ncbi:hypothetical protein LI951_14440 [Enterococcus sp. BWT-B8]|uniref:hypothetical protein n=1 Tax=Enterococcus sp. BWT-B8 TaxID=2885157 RepID=UPI001E5BACB2|nr:hypothetical protein [Enterococcus sp. BWT-B8]MCB5953271.1 hypothetical protein [Enterococcus sp. BWT-B8]